jgi:hypothetical protein
VWVAVREPTRRDRDEEAAVDSKKAMWMAVASGAAALGAVTVRKGLNQAWRVTMDDEPPDDPTSLDVDWRDAILWTFATSVAIGPDLLVPLRDAALGWERFTGELPPD